MRQVSKVQSDDRVLNLIQDKMLDVLNPLATLPLSDALILKSVTLAIGDNVINHGLGRKLVGWFVVRKSAVSNIYDKQGSNTIPALTLILNSSAGCTVDILVF